jgi:ligand-binding SRPBCC domain-containing protein
MTLTNNSYNERGAYAPPTSVFIDICCEGPVMQIGSWTPGHNFSSWDDVDDFFDDYGYDFGPDFELEEY